MAVFKWGGTVEKVSALVHSPPVEGWQAKPDGLVVKVLNTVTPIDLLAQSAVLFFNSPEWTVSMGGLTDRLMQRYAQYRFLADRKKNVCGRDRYSANRR